jgi:hypothetical protein
MLSAPTALSVDEAVALALSLGELAAWNGGREGDLPAPEAVVINLRGRLSMVGDERSPADPVAELTWLIETTTEGELPAELLDLLQTFKDAPLAEGRTTRFVEALDRFVDFDRRLVLSLMAGRWLDPLVNPNVAELPLTPARVERQRRHVPRATRRLARAGRRIRRALSASRRRLGAAGRAAVSAVRDVASAVGPGGRRGAAAVGRGVVAAGLSMAGALAAVIAAVGAACRALVRLAFRGARSLAAGVRLLFVRAAQAVSSLADVATRWARSAGGLAVRTGRAVSGGSAAAVGRVGAAVRRGAGATRQALAAAGAAIVGGSRRAGAEGFRRLSTGLRRGSSGLRRVSSRLRTASMLGTAAAWLRTAVARVRATARVTLASARSCLRSVRPAVGPTIEQISTRLRGWSASIADGVVTLAGATRRVVSAGVVPLLRLDARLVASFLAGAALATGALYWLRPAPAPAPAAESRALMAGPLPASVVAGIDAVPAVDHAVPPAAEATVTPPPEADERPAVVTASLAEPSPRERPEPDRRAPSLTPAVAPVSAPVSRSGARTTVASSSGKTETAEDRDDEESEERTGRAGSSGAPAITLPSAQPTLIWRRPVPQPFPLPEPRYSVAPGSTTAIDPPGVEPPVPIRRHLPRGVGIGGSGRTLATLDLVIDERGRVDRIAVYATGLEKPAALVDLTKDWRFRPATRDGRSTFYRTRIRLTEAGE